MLYVIGKPQIYGVGKIGPKGQVVIPAEARDEIGFKPGDKVMIAGLPDRKSVILMNEEVFNKYLDHMRKNYEEIGEILANQKVIKRNND
jgi:AbrB family looped-hinge helix DNA binding protein